jgi:hypothetical protein
MEAFVVGTGVGGVVISGKGVGVGDEQPATASATARIIARDTAVR